jgi:hypothetical protein
LINHKVRVLEDLIHSCFTETAYVVVNHVLTTKEASIDNVDTYFLKGPTTCYVGDEITLEYHSHVDPVFTVQQVHYRFAKDNLWRKHAVPVEGSPKITLPVTHYLLCIVTSSNLLHYKEN